MNPCYVLLMRYAVSLLPLLLAIAVQAVPQKSTAPAATPKTATRKIPCKTYENASMCYWTHGRLSLYNGNPGWRLWKIGTKRILGIYSGPSRFPPRTTRDSENPEFPPVLEQVYDKEYKRKVAAKDPDAEWPPSIYGDFEVCPLTRERKGQMQDACIESVKVTALENYFPRY